VSGHVLSGESYDQAAVREREEETGITGIPLEKICEFKNFSVIESQWTGLYTCTYDGHIRLNEEATEGRWYTLDELTEALEKRTLTLSPGTRLSLQEYFRRRAT
jgi:NADH pyrophosphatase NudC (nudix superfamily)